MIKKLLLFIFLIICFNSNAQEHGVLIKTVFTPSQGWNGSHAGNHTVIIGSKQISKSSNTSSSVVIEYDFFYVTDNPTQIRFRSSTAGNKDGQDCRIPYDVNTSYETRPYNKDNFLIAYLGGCFADSEVMGIHIQDPEAGGTTETCASDNLTLKGGWNWRYRFSDGIWRNFPANYQAKTTITFKVKDLEGYTNQKDIYFQAGYQTNFTNIMPYKIIGCSPELAVNPPATDMVKCFGQSTGSVTLSFKSEPALKDTDKFLITIYKKIGENLQFSKSIFVKKNELANNSYTWSNHAAGEYVIRYQNQSLSDDNVEIGASAISSLPFTINTSSKFSYKATPVQPKCYKDNGGILITPAGGTPPYYYYLDDGPISERFTNSITIPITTEGNHKVIVIDSYSCIETK
ncbi:SprB repeat-containing protein [Flavobacterium quisquiliarum]|uniref:SprB repeat-containing protein n=1 Tax=Flavobacterium quisquiliarum TaxID=1834436 RepID=A0ABV8WB73_9FLAO|nr:SprB repeat-containing protein [Flavobacterium quisquiliarum]MBW1656229.1 hypothetical protein [Flavobacterium quisquiliarum]NWL02072.1 hypothetical protein [Flavobacterium collinsii]